MTIWKEQLPKFIEAIGKASDESEIQQACQQFKQVVVKQYDNHQTRRRPMAEARKAVREKFPPKEVKRQPLTVQGLYFYTDSGKGKVKRLEHLAIKHLSEEWNPNPAKAAIPEEKPQVLQPSPQVPQVPKFQIESLTVEDLGLSPEDTELVNQALSHISLADLIRKYVVVGAKTEKAHSKYDVASMSNDQLIGSKIKGSAIELVKRAINAIHEWNEPFLGQGEPEKCWCVTVNAVKALTGCRHDIISAVFKEYKELVDGYNYYHELKPVMNRKRRDIRLDITGFKKPPDNAVDKEVGEDFSSKNGKDNGKVKEMTKNATGMDIIEFLSANPDYKVRVSGPEQTLTYERNSDGDVLCLETKDVLVI